LPAGPPGNAQPDAAAVRAVFEPLRAYGEGTSRATLRPLDEAVLACLGDPPARKELERQLVAALEAGGSAAAAEYSCSKLALIGTEFCVPALAALLGDASRATAARTALEAIAHPAAARALRHSLARREGVAQIGAVHSLGAWRDAASVRPLARLLATASLPLAEATVGALGDIGTPAAASALRRFAPRAPAALRGRLADAMLVCAERLHAHSQPFAARALWQMLDTAGHPAHIRRAARRALERAAARP